MTDTAKALASAYVAEREVLLEWKRKAESAELALQSAERRIELRTLIQVQDAVWATPSFETVADRQAGRDKVRLAISEAIGQRIEALKASAQDGK